MNGMQLAFPMVAKHAKLTIGHSTEKVVVL
jgi:hypothetical protein